MSRQIWTFSMSKKTPSTLILNPRCSRETITEMFAWCKISKLEEQLQPVHATEDSTGHCSRNFWWRGKLVTSAKTNNVQRLVWTTETGSQYYWRNGRSNWRICVTLLRYNVEKPETSFAQVRIFAKKTEDEKFQQIVYVNYKNEEYMYPTDVMKSV